MFNSNKENASRKPIFWFVLGLLFLGSALFTCIYYPKVFPIVTLDIKMDRRAALASARSLAQKYNWGPEDFKQAASFRVDSRVKNYVELEAGGSDAFQQLLDEGLYSPYTWSVRHFKEGEYEETLIYFTPSGKPYAFQAWLQEDKPGPSLSPEEALAIAENAAVDSWHIDLSAYELVEKSHEVRSSGRVDHTFVYERPGQRIGQAHYRLRLEVSGEKLTELYHFIKLPEAFSLRYKEMRSANETIADLAFFVMYGLYGFLGCVVGLFFLLRKGWVVWRVPLFWGVFVAFLLALATINQWPLIWMDFDTALSAQGFVLQNIAALLKDFLWDTMCLTLSFMAAESLTRKAFSNHIQLWRLSSSGVANSFPVLGRTVGGYLFAGFDLAFMVGFYFFSLRLLGWWTPSDTLVDPDVLATYFPWLPAIAYSFKAGFWEECLCRAIPLAGAALLGQRFGRRRAWIGGALLLQAIIFGALHANYSAQPAYARVVELMIPSIVYGIIYLRFGLLPSIIAHFTYDAAMYALPLFASSASGIWVDRALVVMLALLPFWVIIYRRLQVGRWNKIQTEDYNAAWLPTAEEKIKDSTGVFDVFAMRPKAQRWVLIGGLLGLVLWVFSADFESSAPPLSIKRSEAETLATNALLEGGVSLNDSWKVLSSVRIPNGLDDELVWEEGGKQAYKELMGKYLSPPQWKVRFAMFEGDVSKRAEEYRVYITGNGKVARVWHKVPETKSGSSLSRGEARKIADSVLLRMYQLKPSSLKEISVEPSKQPARVDWVFTFAAPHHYSLNGGEPRIGIEIAGDEVVDAYRYIYVPRSWSREERSRGNPIDVIEDFFSSIKLFVLVAGMVAGIVCWSRRKFSVAAFFAFFLLLLGQELISLINGWPDIKAAFSTAEPLANQMLAEVSSSLTTSVLVSGALALIAGFVQRWKRPQAEIKPCRALWLGLAMGTAIAGLSSFLRHLAPSLAPNWADYEAAGHSLPILETALAPVADYIKLTIFLLLVIVAVDRLSKRGSAWKYIFTAVLLFLGFRIADTLPESGFLRFWLLEGVLIGTLLLLFYRYVFRYHLAIIPFMVAGICIFNLVREIMFNAYPGVIPGAVSAIILICLFSFYWSGILSETDVRQLTNTDILPAGKHFNLLSVGEQNSETVDGRCRIRRLSSPG